MNQIPITRNGAELLKAELKQLKSVDRPEVVEAIAEARAQGDLSENAEYDAAKERQGFIEGRLAQIEAILSQAVIIDPASLSADGKCVFGVTVEIEDLDEEKNSTYQIVGDDEANIKHGKISISFVIIYTFCITFIAKIFERALFFYHSNQHIELYSKIN